MEDGWNVLDVLSLGVSLGGFCARLFDPASPWGRSLYALSAPLLVSRLLFFATIDPFLGPMIQASGPNVKCSASPSICLLTFRPNTGDVTGVDASWAAKAARACGEPSARRIVSSPPPRPVFCFVLLFRSRCLPAFPGLLLAFCWPFSASGLRPFAQRWSVTSGKTSLTLNNHCTVFYVHPTRRAVYQSTWPSRFWPPFLRRVCVLIYLQFVLP